MNGNGVIDLEDVYILYIGNYGRPLTPTMFSSQLELAYLRRIRIWSKAFYPKH